MELGEKGKKDIRTIPLKPLRDMVELRGTYEELTAKNFYENTSYPADYVHITLTDEEDIPEAMGRLRVIYPYLMKLDYDNMRVAALFDGRRKLMNAPGLGYAVILSRLDKKGRGLKEKGRYYHVALAADGLPVYYHEGPEDEAAMNPLLYGKLRDSEKKAALAEEKRREQAFRARREARRRLVESARKRNT